MTLLFFPLYLLERARSKLRNMRAPRQGKYSEKNNKVIRIDPPEILKARQAL